MPWGILISSWNHPAEYIDISEAYRLCQIDVRRFFKTNLVLEPLTRASLVY
ncbi:DUF4842 domain-containing protein [Vibrio lentus]|nr:DUF4842 domain-containing protein [Vibrio lentus]